jgi:hypothetical protein
MSLCSRCGFEDYLCQCRTATLTQDVKAVYVDPSKRIPLPGEYTKEEAIEQAVEFLKQALRDGTHYTFQMSQERGVKTDPKDGLWGPPTVQVSPIVKTTLLFVSVTPEEGS